MQPKEQQQPDEKRISVRVEPSLYEAVKRIAEDRFESKFSMAAREAFRRFVAQEEEAA